MYKVSEGIDVHEGAHEDCDGNYHGDIANIGFIVGDEAVAVVDTGGSYLVGKSLHEAIRAVTKLPIRYVINTHVHPDHIFGNTAFVDDTPQFIGHAKLAGALAARRSFFLENLTERLGEAAAGTRAVVPQPGVNETRGMVPGGRGGGRVGASHAHLDTNPTNK